MAEVNSGYVTIDAIHYESLIRENAQLRADNERLNGLLYQCDRQISRIDGMYQQLLDRVQVI